jgi:hypothetical protein
MCRPALTSDEGFPARGLAKAPAGLAGMTCRASGGQMAPGVRRKPRCGLHHAPSTGSEW